MWFPVILTLILCYLTYKYTARPKNFPTGPWNLPIVGYLPFLGLRPYVTLSELSKKYGDIFSVNVGSHRTLVLSSFELTKDAMKEDSFLGRPPLPIIKYRSNNKGIIFSVGHNWFETRRFVLRHLRELGFGKSSLQGIVQEEIRELIQSYKLNVGKPVKLQNTFNLAVLNALWNIISGKRFDQGDPKAKAIINTFSKVVFESAPFSFSRLVPIVAKFKGLPKDSIDLYTAMKSMIRDNINEHKETHTEGDASDFMHVFLSKIQEDEALGKPTPFTGEDGMANLIVSTLDLFSAGSETTSGTLNWLFLLVSVYPDVQEKIHQELDRVVGLERLPSLDDKPSLPYTEAVLMECQRFASLLPTLAHQCTAETKFKGYVIPKGTIILPNVYHLLHDPKVWERPNEFYPEHFLTKDGQVKHVAQFIPFGVGKRACIGENLAKMELFLFATALLQTFKFTLPAGKPKPTLDAHPALIVVHCEPYEVVLDLRV